MFTISVVFVGRFFGSGGGYGHMGAYPYQIVVSCVEMANILGKPGPAELPEKILKRAGCY
jgi:hypothetical protein